MGVSFCLITHKEKETFDKTTSHDNIDNTDNIENNDNQSDPGINPQPSPYRDEQAVTQEISPIREPVTSPVIINPLPQPIREMQPLSPDLYTPLPSNKKDHLRRNQQQVINKLEAQISALKSHLKYEVFTTNSKINLLFEVIKNEVNVFYDQWKNFEILQVNKKFFQMALNAKNEIINNLLDTQSRIVESLSLAKQQNSQTELLTKQQTKAQDKPELHPTEHVQPTRESWQQHLQNKHDQKPLYVDQHFLKQQYQSNQRLKKNSKKLYVGNLNTNVTEEDINELFGLKPSEYLCQNCRVKVPIDK